MPARPRVSYYYDHDVGSYSYAPNHPMKPFRMRMTHHLVAAYGLLDKMEVLRPQRATPIQMAAFHTDEYVDFLEKVTPETSYELTGGGQRYLLGELDNPAFEGLFEFCSISAGGSLDAAQRIRSGAVDVAINWAGGLHHAKKREASGFCYVNDIVLCILELLRDFKRVLYIDIDCHHGDGVEEAFYSTDRVLTVSFHKYGEYFPGTGALADRGRGKGLGYSLNVPFRDGLSDGPFVEVFDRVIASVAERYRPDAIVLQCGADSLAGDKLGCLNLSMEAHARSVELVRSLGRPLIVLGGGGYTVRNTARAWAYETACALGVQNDIPRDLPFNEYFEWFGPRFRLEVLPNNMEDLNLQDGYIQAVKDQVERQLHDLPFAPSVQMQAVPRETVARATGIDTGLRDQVEDEDESSRDMDAHITRFIERARRRHILAEENPRTHPRPTRSLRGSPSGLQQLIDVKVSTAQPRRRFFGWAPPHDDDGRTATDMDVDEEDEEDEHVIDEREDTHVASRPLWSFEQSSIVVAAA